MKRSLTVGLVLMGGTILTGCGDSEVDTAVYQNVQQCIEGGLFPAEKCEADFQQAVATHEQTAPAYKTKADCEAEFGVGKCEENPQTTQATNNAATNNSGGSSIFMPLMAGYMMGSILSNNRAVPPQSVYQQQNRSGYYNSNGARVSNGLGATKFSSRSAAAQAPKARTTTMARGGFGTRSAAISS